MTMVMTHHPGPDRQETLMTTLDKRASSETSSRDGTPIAYRTSGQGPPLVLVHGATADHSRWEPLLPLLEPRVTTVAIDRRGRGASGDSPDHDLRREFEDVAAVVDAVAQGVGHPVHLFGHSYGGTCALGAATLAPQLDRLVLYEPAWTAEGDLYTPELLARLEARLIAGEREALLEDFFREVVHMPEDELAAYRSLPAWQRRVQAAHTLPRELRALRDREALDLDHLRRITAPTLLLLGSDSPTFAKAEVERIAGTLADAHVTVLEGQQHIAIDLAPEMVADAVLSFLEPT
jgi:pimeloyl-ACP methyl ester carboxylesterase